MHDAPRPLDRPRVPSPRALLARILDTPALLSSVRSLSPRALGNLIDRVGLEDSGELVALATPEQLAGLIDEALFTNDRPGDDETFDDARFAVLLEVLLEAGSDAAARAIASLPEDLITMALHRRMLVLDLDALVVEMEGSGDDGEMVEKALSRGLSHELDRFLLVARAHDGFDATVEVLTTLDRDDHALVLRLLERCCRMAHAEIDESGLHDALTDEQSLDDDVRGDREDRRAREGHVAPRPAQAFLSLARGALPTELSRDPSTRAYFRELSPSQPPPPPRDEAAARLASMVDEACGDAAPLLLPSRGAALPLSGLFARAVAALFDRDRAAHAARLEELSYLVNALVAGASMRRARLRPVDAVLVATATCNVGLLHLLSRSGERASARNALSRVATTQADVLFRFGFSLAHAPARRLAALFGEGRVGVARQRVAALDGSLDAADHAALVALLDEVPHAAGALLRRGDKAPFRPLATLREIDRATALVERCAALSSGLRRA